MESRSGDPAAYERGVVGPIGKRAVRPAVVRLYADYLKVAFGQSFVGENMPGGSGAIGATVVARAAPDGHTLFVGSNASQWYVIESDAYLWTVSRDSRSYDSQACDVPADFETNSEPSLLYRVPVDGAAPGLIGTRGAPPDQFSLQASGGRFHALLKDRPRYCHDEPDPEARLAYLDFPLSLRGWQDKDKKEFARRNRSTPGCHKLPGPPMPKAAGPSDRETRPATKDRMEDQNQDERRQCWATISSRDLPAETKVAPSKPVCCLLD